MKLSLNEYIIDDRIFNVKFSCDLEKCKGACCTLEGTLGAPILEKEVKEIKKAIPFAKKYLTKEHKNVLSEEGFYIEYENELHLNNVNDNDCVFSFYENGVAKCSIQKAYYNGEVKFIKPISCQLFPIRISGKDRNVLRYEKMYECRDALEKGKEDDVTIFEYLKSGLEREYGKEFYKELKERFVNKDA
jgi:hypothetical protein